jgi:hypothetical protein
MELNYSSTSSDKCIIGFSAEPAEFRSCVHTYISLIFINISLGVYLCDVMITVLFNTICQLQSFMLY